MSEKSDEWYRRACDTTKPRDRLKLIEEVVSSDDAPEFLKNTARRSQRSMKDYIAGGLLDKTQRHQAEHHYQSPKMAFGDVK